MSATESLPPTEPTPLTLPGATQSHTYRPNSPMRLHVFQPERKKDSPALPAFIFFFGGGWRIGAARVGVRWARLAAEHGMVGIAPDYRTEQRFGTTVLDCVADGRAVLRWVQDHADEIGVDASRIAVGGSSAGGHLALWTAIEENPPGSDPAEAPRAKPAALVLLNPCTDTSEATGFQSPLLAGQGDALSPLHHIKEKMPPTLIFHGDDDQSVPYRQSTDLHATLLKLGGISELVTIPGEGHSFFNLDGWKEKTHSMVVEFLKRNVGLNPS